MIRTFTQNDVIRLIYKELTDADASALREQLLCDSALMDFYREMKELHKDLNNAMGSASSTTLSNIINYSKSVNLHTVK